MQSTPKRESVRNKDWSLWTLPQAQIFSESGISTKLFEGRDWLVYKNANIMFNFHQILSKTSCKYISFTVVKRLNPSRAWKHAPMEHEPSQGPTAHPAPMRGCVAEESSGALQEPWEEASPAWRGCVRPVCVLLYSPTSRVRTRGPLGLPCGQDVCAAGVVSYCLIIFFTFWGGKSLQKTSLNVPAEHKFPGKWQCYSSSAFSQPLLQWSILIVNIFD